MQKWMQWWRQVSVRQCGRCVFRKDNDMCEIKDIIIDEVDYDDCWFFRHWDMEGLDKYNDYEDLEGQEVE